VFLGDADVEELCRDFLGEVDEAGAARHGAGDTEHLGVGLGEADEGVAEDILQVGRGARGGGLALARGGIEGAEAVEFLRVGDGGFEAFAFFGEDVDEDRDVGVLGELEVLLEGVEVMAVDGAEVAQAKFLEEGRFDEEVLGLAFPLSVNAIHLNAGGEAREEGLDIVMKLVVGLARADAVEVGRDGADVFGDGPLVVVEDDDEALGGADDVVRGLRG